MMKANKLRIRAWVTVLCLFSSAGWAAERAPAAGQSNEVRIGLSGPVSFLEGEPVWGPYLDFMFDFAPGLKLGGETGFQYWSDSAGTASANLWILPLLVKGLYYYELKDKKAFTPFLGASLGLAIVHGSMTLGAISASATEAKFEGLLHAGADLGESRQFFVDLRLGVVDSSFLLAPTLGIYF